MLQLCQRKESEWSVRNFIMRMDRYNMSVSHSGMDYRIISILDSQEKDPGYFFSSVANRDYLAVTGAVSMTKRELFDKVGGFDERLSSIIMISITA